MYVRGSVSQYAITFDNVFLSAFLGVKLAGRTEKYFCLILTGLQIDLQWVGRCK